MGLSASTWLVIVMLVLAASLASYFLSQWNPVRQRISTWAGVSLGATLLIVTAGITVIALSFVSKLQFAKERESAPLASEQGVRDINPFTQVIPSRTREAEKAQKTAQADRPDAAGRSRVKEQSEASPASTPSAANHSASERRPSVVSSAALGSALVLVNADPWSATQCVVLLRRDPAQETRWTIENDCSAPVGIVIATCAHTAEECDAVGSIAWKYPPDSLALPAKQRRTITEAEQIVYGQHVRDAACVITDAAAIELIGTSVEQRADDWRAQFESARQADDCLIRVRALAERGRRTGLSPDALRGEWERVSAR